MKKVYILVAFALIIILAIAFISYQKAEKINSVDAQNDKSGNGKVLAGSKTPYYEFTKSEYEKALNENKVVLLYFYANWCPICREEQKETLSAFDSLEKENVVGFRVNYKDSETDKDEIELAEKFGISYQHTKIIIKDEKQVLKALDSWSKKRYIEEISKYS